MDYLKYQKIKRLGTQDTFGLLDGKVYVYYKIDGTNASVWRNEDGTIGAGSRNRKLSLDQDNAGFYRKVLSDGKLMAFFNDNPTIRLYGEFLVPHSLKTYKDDAWREFYVFDAMNENDEYLKFEEYEELMKKYNIKYVPPIAILDNPSLDDIYKLLDKTGDFLIKDGDGEGLVCKNYEFINKYGIIQWGKAITDEFKGAHASAKGNVAHQPKVVEEEIVKKYCTEAFINKEYAKILLEYGDKNRGAIISITLNRVFMELLNEEIYDIVKTMKYPTIDFKALKMLVTLKIKKTLTELFYGGS